MNLQEEKLLASEMGSYLEDYIELDYGISNFRKYFGWYVNWNVK